ncbi:MAG TPA: hypothetical protein PKO45_14040 [Rubrivivax sp.]|nr:hypothetical protein [Rubrivivax sp.]
MWLFFIEIAVVLAILGGAVWWTMFSGRVKDEPADAGGDGEPPR